MSDPFADQPSPRGALLGIAALVAFSLLAVVVAQLGGFKAGQAAPGAIAESRDLRFADGQGGTVHVFDAASGQLLAALRPGTENFIRGVLRGLARERRSASLDRQVPFRLARHANGRLTLRDLATGRLVDLRAFGSTNAQSFARLLDTAPGRHSIENATQAGRPAQTIDRSLAAASDLASVRH
jgi:putative photosynthetic complex assembly protein